MTVQFINAEVISCKGGEYGLLVKCGREERCYCSITADKQRLEELTQKINSSEVSLMHIEDILEDFLN